MAKEALENGTKADPLMFASLRDLEQSMKNPLVRTASNEAAIASTMAESRAGIGTSQSPPRAFNAGNIFITFRQIKLSKFRDRKLDAE